MLRRSPSRSVRVVSAALALAVVVVGCGDATSDDGADADATTTRPTTTTLTTADDADPPATTTEPALDDPALDDPDPDPTVTLPARVEMPASVSALEGIAFDPSTDLVVVGDLSNGDLWVQAIGEGGWRVLRTGADDDRSSAIGLAVDPDTRRLYIATGDQGRLDVVDIDTGALIATIPLATTTGSLVNDVTVAPDGTVYVSDSGAPRIYAVAPAAETSEVFLDYAGTAFVDTDAAGLQGNGIVADDNVVLFAHMASGSLMRVDRTSAELTPVDLTGDTTLGRDGLALCGDTLVGVDVAVFNGGQEALRVAELSADRSTADVVDNLPTDGLSSASTAALTPNQLLVVSAQFGAPTPQIPFWITALDTPCGSSPPTSNP